MFSKNMEMYKKGISMAESDLASEGFEKAIRNIVDIWHYTDWDEDLKEGYLQYLCDYVYNLETEISNTTNILNNLLRD